MGVGVGEMGNTGVRGSSVPAGAGVDSGGFCKLGDGTFEVGVGTARVAVGGASKVAMGKEESSFVGSLSQPDNTANRASERSAASIHLGSLAMDRLIERTEVDTNISHSSGHIRQHNLKDTSDARECVSGYRRSALDPPGCILVTIAGSDLTHLGVR